MASIQAQVFCKQVTFDLIEPLLKKICIPVEKGYVVDETAFSRLLFYGLEKDFIETMRPYYYNSKLYYIERKLTFKSFSTIVRQICKASGTLVISSVQYFHSVPLTVLTILP